MRDILNTFGSIKTAASGALTAFPYGIDCGAASTLGHVESLYVKVVIDTKAPAATETVTISIFDDAASTGAGSAIVTETFPARAWKIGDELKVKVPVEHKRYLTVSGAASASSGVGLTAFLERG